MSSLAIGSTIGQIPQPPDDQAFPTASEKEQFWKQYIDLNEDERQQLSTTPEFIKYVWAGIPTDLRPKLWTTVPSNIPPTQFTPRDISSKLSHDITSVINNMELLAPQSPKLDSTQREIVNTVLRIDASTFNRETVVDGSAFLLAAMLPVTHTVSFTLQSYQWLCHILKRFQPHQSAVLHQWSITVVHVIKKYAPEYFPRLMMSEMDLLDIHSLLTTWILPLGASVFPLSFVHQCIDIVLFDPKGAFSLVGVLIGVLYAVDSPSSTERYVYPFLLLDRIMNLPSIFTEEHVQPSFNWGYALYRSRTDDIEPIVKGINWRSLVCMKDLDGVMLNTPLIPPHLVMPDYPTTEESFQKVVNGLDNPDGSGNPPSKPPERRRSTFNHRNSVTASAAPVSPRNTVSVAKISSMRNNLLHLSEKYPTVYPTGYTTLPQSLQAIFQTLIEVEDRISFSVERYKAEQLRVRTSIDSSQLFAPTSTSVGSTSISSNKQTNQSTSQTSGSGQAITTEAELSSLLSKLNSVTEALTKAKMANSSSSALSPADIATIDGALTHTKDLIAELHRKSTLVTSDTTRASFHSSQYHTFSPAATNKDGIIKYDDLGYYLQVPCVVMQGYLCKALFHGNKIGSIIRRFYLLQGPFLTEFESHIHKEAHKNRSIDMRGRRINLLESTSNGFGIEVHAHGDSNAILLLVFARSDEERRRWAASLAAVTRLPRIVRESSTGGIGSSSSSSISQSR